MFGFVLDLKLVWIRAEFGLKNYRDSDLDMKNYIQSHAIYIAIDILYVTSIKTKENVILRCTSIATESWMASEDRQLQIPSAAAICQYIFIIDPDNGQSGWWWVGRAYLCCTKTLVNIPCTC